MSDTDLLQRFVRNDDQNAFAELARRHIALVYAAACRHLNGDGHLAEDVSQQVFVDLAHKARTLVHHECLAGWLYACTRFTALNTIRSEQRRAAREKDAMPPDRSPDWQKVRPVIDDALQELDDRDRQFVILRYFELQPLAAIAAQFSVTENAVQKAVARFMDLLSAALARRGVTSTAAALAATLAAEAIAAPPTLLPAISSAVGAIATTAPVGGFGLALPAALKVAAACAGITVIAAATGYWTGQQRQLAADLREFRADEAVSTTRIHSLEDQVRLAHNRAAAAEADTATLLRAVNEAKAARLAAATVPTPVARPPLSGTRYAVQPGDTFAKIARAYGISTAELSAANPGYDWRRMRVGQLLTLPRGAALVDESSGGKPNPRFGGEYTVSTGDTPTRIVVLTGVPFERLQTLNPGLDWSALFPGQRLRLK
ncbi:MAG TPA: sigma-70 family RNA polymerase sigma factor [Opitutaceae bacterium]|nr:sigma-70 family RNA polymerase sigma factor [Opitutaceae bacterium]